MGAEGKGCRPVTLYICLDSLLNYYYSTKCSWALGTRWETCIIDWSLGMLNHSQVNFDIELLRENFECCATAAFILVHFPLECALSVPLSLNIPLFACAAIDSEFLSSSSRSGLQTCSSFT